MNKTFHLKKMLNIYNKMFDTKYDESIFYQIIHSLETVNKDCRKQLDRLIVLNCATVVFSISLIIFNIIFLTVFKENIREITRITIIGLILIIILNNLKTTTIKIKKSSEKDLKSYSTNDLEARCFWLSKIISRFNLKDVFSEYLVIQKELSKREQEQNHDK